MKIYFVFLFAVLSLSAKTLSGQTANGILHVADGRTVRQYATFNSCWNISGHVFRVASGANGDDFHWTEVMMRDISRNLIAKGMNG